MRGQEERGKENKVAGVAAPAMTDQRSKAQEQLLITLEKFPNGISMSKVRPWMCMRAAF